MTHPPPFSLLPYEIISQICQHPDLDKDDLAALRLTCKSHGIHDAATASLGKCFEDITVLFSEHSFETLVNICKHPVFSRCIRSVKVSSVRCNKYETLDTIVQGLQHEDPLLDLSKQLAAGSEILTDFSARIRSYVSRAQNEAEFARSSKPLALLNQAFHCLVHAGGRIALGVTVRETNGLGCKKVLVAKDTLNCQWHNAFCSTLELFATAILACKLTFTKLKIDIVPTEHAYISYGLRRTIGTTTVALLSHAEALDLDLFCYNRCEIDPNVARIVQNDIPGSIQIKALRLVGIDTPGWSYPSFIQNTLRFCVSVSSLCPESLSLVRIEMKTLDLQTFLAKTQGTLRHLSIINYVYETSWVPAVVYIKDHLTAISELHLAQDLVRSDLFVDEESSEERKKRHEGELLAWLDCYGQSDIQSSLAEVLASCENFVPLPRSADAVGDGDGNS